MLLERVFKYGKKYVVKSANYAGGTYVTTEVDGSINNNNNENSNNSNNNSNNNINEINPQTYDGIMVWIILGLVSMSGIIVTSVYKKKKNV